MIILKDHFNEKDTVIYGDAVSNGYQTFHIDQLDEICKKCSVPEEIKKDVLKHHKENLGNDDMSANIFEQLKVENNETVNHAVALATQNDELLEEMTHFFNDDFSLRIIIAKRKNLPKKINRRINSRQTL